MKATYLLLLIVMNLFWAGSYSAFKALSGYLDAGGVVTLRFSLAALGALVLWPLLPGKAPRGTDLLRTALMGVVVFAVGPRLQVAGVQLGQAGDASVLMALEPLITSVGAALFLREHITPRRWLGFSLGLLGVVLLSQGWRREVAWPSLAANALFVSSFVCETAYSIMGKPLIQRAGLMKVIAIALLAGTLVNLVADGATTMAAARAMPLKGWLVIAYLTFICTLTGYAIWFVVIRETEVNVTALTIFIQPIAGVTIALLWLGEPLHWGQLWGSAVIVTGLAVGLPRLKTAAGPRSRSAERPATAQGPPLRQG